VKLGYIDASIVVAYFVLVLFISVLLERRASKSIQSYFLAEGSMPWWLLGMSGSSTYFDITGTMWMVSVFYVLGMRGMWEHAFWCFPFAGFVMAYKAKWAYRSGVLTGMEWLVFRYGEGRAGRAARLMNVIIVLIIMTLMIGYAGIGVGKFMEEFLNIPKSEAVPLVFIFTGAYVTIGGFFSVVYTDFIQTVLLSFAAIYLAVAAFFGVNPAAFRATVGSDWFSLMPVMKLSHPTPEYPDLFGLLVILWVSKGLISLVSSGAGGVDFQRFRAARNEGEASKIGFAWGMVISVRWALVMGITVFGLSILSGSGKTIDSERVLPIVINQVLPVGVKGLVIAGLLAAFMSTFDSTLNVAASFVVNDLVKPFWKSAGRRTLMSISYLSTITIVLIGVIISLYTDRIASLWNPINFALGAALIAPGFLASYWWRLGGWAFCISGACTLPVAFYIKVFTNLRELQYFPILAGVSFTSCILASFLFPPAPRETLMNFYSRVRPFGFWGPVRKMLAEAGEDPGRPPQDRLDIPVAIVATAFFIALYLLMMDLVLHNWPRAGIFALFVMAGGFFLYMAWWRLLKTD